MGKDLTKHNENTREVLFEKHEHYYYKFHHTSRGYGLKALLTPGGICMEDCTIKHVRIGSGSCKECIFNKAFDSEKHFVICTRIKDAIKK